MIRNQFDPKDALAPHDRRPLLLAAGLLSCNRSRNLSTMLDPEAVMGSFPAKSPRQRARLKTISPIDNLIVICRSGVPIAGSVEKMAIEELDYRVASTISLNETSFLATRTSPRRVYKFIIRMYQATLVSVQNGVSNKLRESTVATTTSLKWLMMMLLMPMLTNYSSRASVASRPHINGYWSVHDLRHSRRLNIYSTGGQRVIRRGCR